MPYLLHGVLLNSEDHTFLPHATVSSPSLRYGRLSGWQSEFTLEIPDSLFVKDRFLLKIKADGYDFPGMEVNKKMFKANEALITIFVPRMVIRLD